MSLTRRRFLAASGALLGACGGGGGTQYIGGPPPTTFRSDILYGFFGDDIQQAAEVASFTNLYWSAPWEDPAGNILRARAAGLTEFVILCTPSLTDPAKTIAEVATYLGTLPLQGVNLRGLYWCDEPNALPDSFVRVVNAGLRHFAPLWTIFADNPGRPGLDDGPGAWDVVGIDQYDIGCNVLGTLNDELGRRMKPGARRILVPGPVGGHFSQSDPVCFENFAHTNPDVLAIVPFIWIDRWGNVPTNLGIRSIPALRATYTALGKRLTGK